MVPSARFHPSSKGLKSCPDTCPGVDAAWWRPSVVVGRISIPPFPSQPQKVRVKSGERYGELVGARREMIKMQHAFIICGRGNHLLRTVIGKLHLGRGHRLHPVRQLPLSPGRFCFPRPESASVSGLSSQGNRAHQGGKSYPSNSGNPPHDYLQPHRAVLSQNRAVLAAIETNAHASFAS